MPKKKNDSQVYQQYGGVTALLYLQANIPSVLLKVETEQNIFPFL